MHACRPDPSQSINQSKKEKARKKKKLWTRQTRFPSLLNSFTSSAALGRQPGKSFHVETDTRTHLTTSLRVTPHGIYDRTSACRLLSAREEWKRAHRNQTDNIPSYPVPPFKSFSNVSATSNTLAICPISNAFFSLTANACAVLTAFLICRPLRLWRASLS